MEIIKFPHPDLFTVCKEVTVFGPELKVLLDSMWDLMLKERGVGLAGNQVSILYRIVTMQGPNKERLYIINPKITKRSLAPANLKEGCLSSPGEFYVLAERSAWVEVEYQDETGKAHRRVFQGLYSVAVEHELGHLNGASHLQSKSIPKAKRIELAKKYGLK